LLAFQALFKKEHLRIGRYLAHLVQLFQCRRASDAHGEQQALSYLKKGVKNKISFFDERDE